MQQKYSCEGSENWQIGEETSARAAQTLKILYKSEKGGVVKTFTGHKDIRESWTPPPVLNDT